MTRIAGKDPGTVLRNEETATKVSELAPGTWCRFLSSLLLSVCWPRYLSCRRAFSESGNVAAGSPSCASEREQLSPASVPGNTLALFGSRDLNILSININLALIASDLHYIYIYIDYIYIHTHTHIHIYFLLIYLSIDCFLPH